MICVTFQNYTPKYHDNNDDDDDDDDDDDYVKFQDKVKFMNNPKYYHILPQSRMFNPLPTVPPTAPRNFSGITVTHSAHGDKAEARDQG